MKCELCDRETREPWVVLHWPGRALHRAITFAQAIKATQLVGWQITTCGEAVCIFRARSNGVPGATYESTP